MSPEDIFASQMWPWPDPALKRDSMGRVLFVNAAFLQMYGGTIDDWRGNIVTGWPAPQAPGQPYRFETRLPTEDGGEQVYDWMEFTLADGNAFAMARNVTYLFQPTDPQPGTEAQPAILATQQADAVHDDITAINTPSAQPAYAETVVETPVAQDQPVMENIVENSDPIAEAAQSIEVPQDVEVPEFEQDLAEIYEVQETQTSETQIADVQAPEPQALAMGSVASAAAGVAGVGVVAASVVGSEPSQAQEPVRVEEERSFEKRPLPIENDDAVLGNNWRDAVIAKAVGAEDTVEANLSADESETTPASGDDSGSIRILLAEDNAINALLTRTLLEAEGHTVDTAEDGVLAVEAMKNSNYDLIFMDMRMPNMDGLEATRKIRAMDNVSKGLPIIALTANAFDDDRNACFDSGMNDFMTKPVSAEELSEMVKTWTKNLAERNAA